MRAYPKYCDCRKNGKCYLILILQNKPKKFSHAKNPSNYSDIYFNIIPLKSKNTQKHLSLSLDAKPNISENINEKKVQGINIIKKLKLTLPNSFY